MVRIKMLGTVTKAAADALKKRATPMLTRFKVEEASVSLGIGTFKLGDQSFKPYYVLTFTSPESCPVRKYVAYTQDGELKTRALLKADRTIEDLEALETT